MSDVNKPLFGIVGRPNVGKSTLFNYLVDSRRSVVKNQPGVTRDLIFEEAELWGKVFEVVDTGGITEAEDEISTRIREHVLNFLKSVDYLIVVMDYKSGLCPEDREMVRIANESGKPFILAINKVDKSHELDMAGAEFYEFGVPLVSCSFENRHGVDQLLEWIHERINNEEATEKSGYVLSIVGKPNAGKSSLCNQLLGEKKMLVSDVAGTTVDSVDFNFSYNDQEYRLYDTAGLRRTSKRTEDIEVISAFKTSDAIRKSQIVLLMVDGIEGPSEQDTKILQEITDAHKGVILVVNKLDLGEANVPEFRKTTREKLAQTFHFYPDIPITFISAKTGKGLKDLFAKIEEVREKLSMKISTTELNDFFINVIRQAPSPVWGTKNVKFYYLTQTKQTPPSFIAFANHPDGVDNAYRRFLMKRIKARWGLEGIPIRIFVMKSKG
ncbi:MAG: ribosome biogenesis GTPase Der [Bdellovibrionales bacterium]|nr:ribosome biogenesis GTPase Der [Bdellovibrionales bacterium]